MSLTEGNSLRVRAFGSRLGLLLSLLVGGCTPALAMRAPDVSLYPGRLAVMETNIEISELGESGLLPRPDWTKAAQVHVDSAIRVRARANGAKLLNPEDLDEVEYLRFYRWAFRSLDQIAARIDGKVYRKAKSVTQWRYDRTLEPWRAKLGSDNVLVVLFRDAHRSAGQMVADFFGNVQVHVRQVGIACVVSLAPARVVWCEYLVDGYGDLRTAASAKSAVDGLIAGLLPR